MAEVVLTEPFLDVFKALTPREQAVIVDHLDLLQTFPKMYPVRDSGPRVFRGLRYFIAFNWHV